MIGPSVPIDPRTHAYRDDLCDIALGGRILAPHYARALLRSCGSRPAAVRAAPGDEPTQVSELLPGETFAVLEYAGGAAWGYCTLDSIVGYIDAIALVDPSPPTHIVCEKCAPVMPDDRVNSPILASLPMGSLLHGEESGASLATEYGCVPLSHLRQIGEHDDDPVLVAERLINAPWLEGGRSICGIDASGLVQLSLILCGIEAPRLIDQLRNLGSPIPDNAPLRRADLIASGDEIGLMIDDLLAIHACRVAGKVTVSPAAAFDRSALYRRRLST